MSEQDYFKQALQNFTFDVASKGAVCHLADSGFTVDQIMKKLDFPTPYDRVQQTVWEHFRDTGYLLLEEPGKEKRQEKFSYVTDYDQYGRKSFRRVTVSDTVYEAVRWKEQEYKKEKQETFSAFLTHLCARNGEKESYVSCDFGLRSKREPQQFLRDLQFLDEYQREYVMGIPWERKLVYHRLDQRMREIVSRLYEQGAYHGRCYFLRIKEKIRF